MSAKTIVMFLACLGLSLASRNSVDPTPLQNQGLDRGERLKAQARQKFMRGKLESNQKIVEGLALSNFGLIRDGAEEVAAVVKGQHWFVLDTPEYREHSKVMRQAAGQLAAAAGERNIEAAALRYFDLTLNCIDCHRYIETQQR